ncbi:MAG: deoxyribodipyrimidine photo-lyase [Candidatus Omnitrophota bacterium]
MTKPAAIVWFRRDLRLDDQPALAAAARESRAVIPVFIWSPEDEGLSACGAASRWWLHHALRDFQALLGRRGLKLTIRRGAALEELRQLLGQTGAAAVYWNRLVDPALTERDRQIEQSLRDAGVAIHIENGNLLFDPWQLLRGDGRPYKVFTPFWKNLQSREESRGFLRLAALRGPSRWPKTLTVDSLGLLPKTDWAKTMRRVWNPGPSGAHKLMRSFMKDPVTAYRARRDLPAEAGTSRLSPHLHFGEISVRRIFAEAEKHPYAQTWIRQLAWREFAHHLLYYFPHTPEKPMRPEYANFPWREDPAGLRAWQEGKTGYPLVDAGMRELWATGWMHNRVRMIAASFLVKHLLIRWQEGAAWFWNTLVDADLANNTMGWQWVTGCGADAAPYFRIFNPVLQGEKFDPQGDYVRRWVPELSRMSPKWIHRPWEAPAGVLAEAGLRLGKDYPEPVVDHTAARRRALLAFSRMRR